MDGIKDWAAALCVAAIGCALMQMLAPKDGMGKIFKLMLGAFFLCCMTMPLLQLRSISGLDVGSLPSEVTNELLQEKVDAQLRRQVETTVRQLAEKALESRGVKAEKIAVTTDTSEDGGIYIQQVTIYLDKQNKPKALAAREVLEQQLGVSVVLDATG